MSAAKSRRKRGETGNVGNVEKVGKENEIVPCEEEKSRDGELSRKQRWRSSRKKWGQMPARRTRQSAADRTQTRA
jgi:hypothetical protein